MLSQLLFVAFLLSSFAQALVLEQRATARTTSPSGCLVVQGTGTATGQYATFASAIAALGSGTTSKCIFMYPGTYKEQVRVTYGGNLTIYGYTSE
jgi:pectinesterase